MAKITTKCPCGGSYDGTPSGLKVHQMTRKHQWGMDALSKDAAAAEPGVTSSGVERAELTVVSHDTTGLPAEKAKAKPAGKASTATKDSAKVRDAKAQVAKFRRYVAYAAKESNHVRPENVAKYSKQLAEAEATLAKLQA